MNPYFEQQILGSEPVELVRLLYKRALECVREAREYMKAGLITERSRAICRAYEALSELLSSLREEAAPEMASRLRDIYGYAQQRLLDANFQQADAPLSEVLGLLSTLLEAWDQIASGGYIENPQRGTQDGTWHSHSLSGEPGQIAVSA